MQLFGFFNIVSSIGIRGRETQRLFPKGYLTIPCKNKKDKNIAVTAFCLLDKLHKHIKACCLRT
ncbi:MAG: hypothetical protein LBS36_00915 [Oscillospiraceae bacterium]|jgi:hypothetical protein|nr:hypothetical protein [Oscillospiraceae bacterium]